MIILDTNVVSEVLKPMPDAKVMAWLDALPEENLFLTAVSIAELRSGVEIMPDGRRKENLRGRMSAMLVATFEGRILPFDAAAAEAYARIASETRRNGCTISVFDCQIAAIARSRAFDVASRDAAPFREAGIAVINPWTDE